MSFCCGRHSKVDGIRETVDNIRATVQGLALELRQDQLRRRRVGTQTNKTFIVVSGAPPSVASHAELNQDLGELVKSMQASGGQQEDAPAIVLGPRVDTAAWRNRAYFCFDGMHFSNEVSCALLAIRVASLLWQGYRYYARCLVESLASLFQQVEYSAI